MGKLIFSAMVVPAFAKDSCNRSSRKDSIIKAFFFFRVHVRSQDLDGLILLKIYAWATEGVLNQRKKKKKHLH